MGMEAGKPHEVVEEFPSHGMKVPPPKGGELRWRGEGEIHGEKARAWGWQGWRFRRESLHSSELM